MSELWPQWQGVDEKARVHAAHRAGEPAGLRALLALTGCPLDELWPTVYSARVCALAANAGHAFVHHERRVWTALPPSLAPDASSAAEASTQGPQWIAGVLEIPKYFGAFLDAPLATYDPNHRHKWRSHELLHRRVGFFWRPDMTPFEAYLGARLSELLPIVHWYGLDEIGRPRCPEHQGRLLRREFCSDCEDLRAPYWEQAAPSDASIEHWLSAAKSHLHEELEVIRREAETGRAIASPRPGLDASSDAQAYMRGHWPRMTAWSFGSWVELFGRAGVDYEDTVAAMIERVENQAAELFEGSIEVEPERAPARRERQRLRDLGYRLLCALEWSEDEGVESRLWPHLEALAMAADALNQGEGSDELASLEAELWAAWRGEARAFPTRLVQSLPEVGLCFGARNDGPASVEQVREGLRSAFPDVVGEDSVPQVESFVVSDAFSGPGSLAARYLAFLGDSAAEALRLEGWLRARPLRDLEGETLAGLPEGAIELQFLRPNLTLRTGEFSASAVEKALGWRPDDTSVRLAAVWVRGEPRVIECDDEKWALLRALEDGRREELAPSQTLLDLLDASFAFYLPAAR